MSARDPLDDNDRAPWLERVAAWVEARLRAGESGVITCSALKRSYRDAIARQHGGVVFVYLAGSRETIAARLATRNEHFMPARLLDSKFADLQPPAANEAAIRVDIGGMPHLLAQTIVDVLGLRSAARRYASFTALIGAPIDITARRNRHRCGEGAAVTRRFADERRPRVRRVRAPSSDRSTAPARARW